MNETFESCRQESFKRCPIAYIGRDTKGCAAACFDLIGGLVDLLPTARRGNYIGAGVGKSEAQGAANASADAHMQAQAAQIERKASDYRRALGACLEGRGYSIK